MIDMLPTLKKTQYNQVQNTIKQLAKQIKQQKAQIVGNLYPKQNNTCVPLFEVEPSEIEQISIDNISSFFGVID